jgi:hypothetical protein
MPTAPFAFMSRTQRRPSSGLVIGVSGVKNTYGKMRGAVISLRSLRFSSLTHHSTPLPQPGSRIVVMP